MRRLIAGLVVAAVAALVPTWSLAGNQEVAEQIGANLRNSGQLRGHKIAVKYQDGIVWLKGSVASEAQKKALMDVALNTPGVNRVVGNSLAVGSSAQPSQMIQASANEPIVTPVWQQSLEMPLQTASGALTAEQTPRSFSHDMRGTAVTQRMPTPVVDDRPMAVPAVEAITEVAAGPQLTEAVRPTALQEPAATVPTPAAEAAAAQPAAVPQPAVAQPMRPLPAQGAYPVQTGGAPLPAGAAAVRYDRPNLPNYAWPGYAAYPNYAAVTYPKQYAPTAWPYIGPFYPYPQVPMGWRKVTLEWHDGYWNLDFDDGRAKGYFSGLFRPFKH